MEGIKLPNPDLSDSGFSEWSKLNQKGWSSNFFLLKIKAYMYMYYELFIQIGKNSLLEEDGETVDFKDTLPIGP